MAKYSIVELNKVASRKTGEIEAQCVLNKDIESLQNDQIGYIEAAKDEIALDKNENCVDAMYLHFSNPRRYEDGKTGMENFRYESKDDKVLPRLFKLTAGDLFFTDYKFETLPEGIVAVEKSLIPTDVMPNGKEGQLYRVIA